MKGKTFTEWFASELLDVPYEEMNSEDVANIFTDRLYESLDGIDMTDEEYEKFSGRVYEFVDDFFFDAVDLVKENNEQVEAWDEARRGAEKGDH